MSATFDLDAARQARREAKGEAPVVRFGGGEFVLTPELPFAFSELWTARRYSEAIETLFDDPADAKRFLDLRPTFDDVDVMVDKVYLSGGVGESDASSDS